MRDWKIINPDRREATIEFRNFMENPQNAAIRQRCCDDPVEAKRQFAIVGKFYLDGEQLQGQPPNDGTKKGIPTSVQFKVYDSEDEKRHDLVVLVLPSSKGEMSPEATDVWIAAWPVWAPIDEMIAQLEARLAMLRQERDRGNQ